MKLIKPSFEILEQGFNIDDIYKHIELCGRTCYKSTDKITESSAKPFVDRMINSKHLAMLEHGTVYLIYNVKDLSEIGESEYHKQQVIINGLISKYFANPYSKVVINKHYDTCFITTNYRVIIENHWEEDLQYLCEPNRNHIKRYTVRFICNRQVSHEFVRHRVFSFAQESTRYCNYTKDKFDKELTFIQPCWIDEEYIPGNYNNSEQFTMLIEMLENIESTYNFMINHGWKPQQAATVLPNALKTELIMTGFADETGWKHFFDLRAKGTTGTPHPQAKELAESLMKEFINRKYIDYETKHMV